MALINLMEGLLKKVGGHGGGHGPSQPRGGVAEKGVGMAPANLMEELLKNLGGHGGAWPYPTSWRGC